MEFLNKMKSRERIEMVLKTISVVIIGLILIILMEGMIYSIYMNKINDTAKDTQFINHGQTVAYCEEIGEDEYKVYLHNIESNSWQLSKTNLSEDSIKNNEYFDVVWHKPNAFDVSITNSHYVVMVIFELAIIGFYGWRFFKLDKEYKKFEKKYKKTGNIFA